MTIIMSMVGAVSSTMMPQAECTLPFSQNYDYSFSFLRVGFFFFIIYVFLLFAQRKIFLKLKIFITFNTGIQNQDDSHLSKHANN